MKKILAIGENGTKELAQELFQQEEIDIAATGPDKKQKEYDALLSYMTLARVPFRKVDEVVKSWVDALKQGGEIVIFVPSLEWAAVQILSPERSPALILHLYGMQTKPSEFNSCAFTFLDLRSMCSLAGIAVTHASTGEYMIGEHACECHSVRGIKK
jgi:hypothetical protein